MVAGNTSVRKTLSAHAQIVGSERCWIECMYFLGSRANTDRCPWTRAGGPKRKSGKGGNGGPDKKDPQAHHPRKFGWKREIGGAPVPENLSRPTQVGAEAGNTRTHYGNPREWFERLRVDRPGSFDSFLQSATALKDDRVGVGLHQRMRARLATMTMTPCHPWPDAVAPGEVDDLLPDQGEGAEDQGQSPLGPVQAAGAAPNPLAADLDHDDLHDPREEPDGQEVSVMEDAREHVDLPVDFARVDLIEELHRNEHAE